MRTFLLFLTIFALAAAAQAQRTATVTAIAPTFGPAGTTVCIRGAGFNDFEPVTVWVKELANEPPPGIVDFNGVPGDILFWQDDLITVKVPKGASAGPVRVIIPGARLTATELFDVYYSTSEGKPAVNRDLAPQDAPRSSEEPTRSPEREPQFLFDYSEPWPGFFYANPWFSGLTPGQRTFFGEQGFTGGFVFGNPFSLRGRHSLFSGRDTFRVDSFGFHNPFFGNFFFRGPRAARMSPFRFRF